MTFSNWIEDAGPKTIAQSLGVDPSTVSNWKSGKAFPRPQHMQAIFKISKGRVSYKEMVFHFLRKNKSK